jgi:hypothetical protein
MKIDRTEERKHMRKKTAFFGILVASAAILAGAASPAFAQEPTRKVLYSLEPGETIMHAESIIALTAEAADIILVTTKGKGDQGPFFVFRDGAKKGPFTSLKDAMAAAYADRKNPSQRKRDCAAYTPGPAPAGAQPTSAEAKAGKTLQFKGATLGPHAMIFSNRVTPDGALAYITAADNDKAWFECSDGRKVSFGGLPADFKFSPDGKNAAVLVQGRFSMNEMNNFAKLPPEKLADAYKEMDKKYLYTIDGKKFGPFDSFEPYSFWFLKTSNDLYFRVEDQVFRNGAPMIKAESFDSCNFYPSPDGKSYAMFNYSNITFSDGKEYPSPLDVLAYQDKGKTVFKWITLENNKDLVVYQRAM